MNKIKLYSLMTLITFICTVIPAVPVSARTHSMDKRFFEETGDIVWNVKTTKKVMALTFDDGPHPQYTSQILDILKKYNVKATFFIVGENVEKNKKLLIRELEEGHELGNHTFTHPNSLTTSLPKLKEEVLRTDRAIFNATGTHPRHFRSPGGAYDSEIVEMSKQFNYDFILWSWWEDTKDWSRPGVNKIVQRVMANPQNGDIVLFHDYVLGKSQTPEALEIVLPKLKEKGFEFVTISKLLEIKKQELDNKDNLIMH